MSIINHINQDPEYEATCPFCKQQFIYSIHPQTPGFRDTEELNCPYCKKTINTSMTWEFTSWKK